MLTEGGAGYLQLEHIFARALATIYPSAPPQVISARC